MSRKNRRREPNCFFSSIYGSSGAFCYESKLDGRVEWMHIEIIRFVAQACIAPISGKLNFGVNYYAANF